VVILGDFNAVTGTDRTCYPTVLGPHGHGTPNDNSERLLNFCSGAGLRTGGLWFQRKDIHRLTWFSNDGFTAKEIDHVLVNTRWSLLRNCRTYRSLEFDTDHLPVIATLAIRLKRLSKKTITTPLYLNVRALQNQSVSSRFELELSNRFAALDEDSLANWECFRETMQEVANITVGNKPFLKRAWISDKTRDLICQKRDARLHREKVAYKSLSQDCRSSIRQDRQTWAETMAAEGEQRLHDGQLHDAFANFRQLRSSFIRFSAPISAADGTLLSDRCSKLACWREHYEGLLNRQPTSPPAQLVQDASVASPSPDIPVDPPTQAEVISAINKLRSSRAPGICGIHPNN